MPDKTNPPPLEFLVGSAVLLGIITQLAVNLALGLTQRRRVLIGLLILSGLLSGGTTLLLARLTEMDPYVAATIGTLMGAAPPLLVLRAGLQAAAKRAGLDPAELLGATPPAQAGWLTPARPPDTPEEVAPHD